MFAVTPGDACTTCMTLGTWVISVESVNINS